MRGVAGIALIVWCLVWSDRRSGTDLIGMREYEITQLGIGRKFQAPSIYGNLTVWENLDLSLSRPSKDVLPTLLGKSTPAEREQIDQTLDTIGLKEQAQLRAESLSHGQKQWLEIGMVILQDPELLLVDEPVAGMTDEETEQTGRLLKVNVYYGESHILRNVSFQIEAGQVNRPKASSRRSSIRSKTSSSGSRRRDDSPSSWSSKGCISRRLLARATRGLRVMGGEQPDHPSCSPPPHRKQCSVDDAQ